MNEGENGVSLSGADAKSNLGIAPERPQRSAEVASLARRVQRHLLLIIAAYFYFGALLGPLVTTGAFAGQLQDRLAADVQFLSQPKLQGRKMRTAGARRARQYIEKEFKACGVLPWGGTKSLELSFGLGKNVAGVIPGTDPELSNEIVLLSAHYDHVGKDPKGGICPGAADNASGVAVLLEAARWFSMAEHRPKRTIGLVAFDAEEEMLLGSFAFVCRPDVEQARIVAVVNVDMLGRDFLDTIQNTVFIAGTESYPDIRRKVCNLGSVAGMRVLPLGSDLIGPRSDHVAFEHRNIPCLFFSCGTFKDYHQPGDKASKLNYICLERSAKVILQAVDWLASKGTPLSSVASGCDLEELKSLNVVVSELSRDPQRAAIKTNDLGALAGLQTSIEKLLETGAYTPRARERLILDAARSLGGYFITFGDEGRSGTNGPAWSDLMPLLEHLYLNYHRQLMEGQRRFVAQALKRPPGLFHGIPAFHYEMHDIPADDISMVRTGAGTFALHALGNGFTLNVQSKAPIWLFGGLQVGLGASFEVLDCQGSQEKLLDYCLLYFHASPVPEEAKRRVLSAVMGSAPEGGYKEWLQARLKQRGYRNENQWIISCLSSPNPVLAREALTLVRHSKDPRVRSIVCDIIRNRALRADVRACAIEMAPVRPDKSTLLSVADVLDDPSPTFQREYCPQFAPDYPLAGSPTFQVLKPLLEQAFSQPADTIGQSALKALRKATKRDFGMDRQKWKAFLEKSR